MGARSYTLLQMRDRARSEADMVNSLFVTDAEANAWLNSNLCEVYDLLVQAGLPDYYAASSTITTAAGTIGYALPSDFRNATVLYNYDTSSQRKQPVRNINDWDVAQFQPPQGVYTLQLRYVPDLAPLVNDSDTFAGFSGWEELAVAMTARDMLLKEESDASGIVDRIERLKVRIRTASSQRDGGPQYITNVNNAKNWNYQFPGSRITGYLIRGDQIELYEPAFWAWY